MRNTLLYIAAFCCIASVTLAAQRKLDSTLLVTKHGLTVLDGASPIQFKCGREWSIAFTNNGGTATLRTKKGHWTLKGLSAPIAVAAVNEVAPVVVALATNLGIPQAAVTDALKVALALAQSIGSSQFDGVLTGAVALANDFLDSVGIHPADFNDEILAAIDLLGPSGGVLDVSDVTVVDVQRNATRVLGMILNALASAGVIPQ